MTDPTQVNAIYTEPTPYVAPHLHGAAPTPTQHPEFVSAAETLVEYLKAQASKHQELVALVSKFRADIDEVHAIITKAEKIATDLVHSVEEDFKTAEKNVKNFWSK